MTRGSRGPAYDRRGFAFVELLIVITLLGIAGVAAIVVGHAAILESHRASAAGRQASVDPGHVFVGDLA